MANQTRITVKVSVNAPLEVVWDHWTSPESITKWNVATEGWHTPRASLDLHEGGVFSYRMESLDGKVGFDFEGTYKDVQVNEYICYTIADGREVEIFFEESNGTTSVKEVFDAEEVHSVEQQREGWQSILISFKLFVEQDYHHVEE